MIQIRHLTKKYGEHLAVDDVSFNVEKGQVYGFLGPNGAGKTTTMNMITGYMGATSGEIKINGYDIFEEPEFAKRCIGYLPEHPPLYMDMTPYSYLKFAAQLKKIDRLVREDMIEDIIKKTKIYDVKDRLIRNLSKGYKQRVGLAQALLGYPEILILDEPTVGLDPRQIREIRDLIKEIGKSHTVILSSHILAEVSAICDYVLIINKGKLVASDTPENLTKHLQASASVLLTVMGERDAVEKVLRVQKYVQSYEITESSEEGAVDVKLKGEDSTDLRKKLFTAFANAQCPITKMEKEEVSLEDAFLELVQPGEDDENYDDYDTIEAAVDEAAAEIAGEGEDTTAEGDGSDAESDGEDSAEDNTDLTAGSDSANTGEGSGASEDKEGK